MEWKNEEREHLALLTERKNSDHTSLGLTSGARAPGPWAAAGVGPVEDSAACGGIRGS